MRAQALRAQALLAIPLLLGGCGATPQADAVNRPQQQYHQVFESAAKLREFRFSDPAAWEWRESGELELIGPSRYVPPYRSPASAAMISHLRFTDFALELDMMQTGREYGHRDLCIFFGFVGRSQYYYVHLATTPDENAHNVFIVDGADRRPLAPVAAQGVEWGTEVWHRVRLERSGSDIRVFFDDMETPILVASDATFPLGNVGFGSFDDTGRFDNIRIWSNKVIPPSDLTPFSN